MRKMESLVGKRFGRLVVLSESEIRIQPCGKKKRRWRCLCDCGQEKEITQCDLISGHTRSCGCWSRDSSAITHTTHGHTMDRKQTTEYITWATMIKRCENPNGRGFYYYGRRGVKVCERWRTSFEAFLFDMGKKPSPKHSIDRINNDGNYEPGNCRWATKSQQMKNRRPPLPEGPYNMNATTNRRKGDI